MPSADPAKAAHEPIEAVDLERAAEWRIKKLGENPADAESREAAKSLQKLADELRRLRGAPVYTEYLAILNWLGEFDVTEEFAERADSYRSHIGVEHFPENAEAYLQGLIALAKDTAGM